MNSKVFSALKAFTPEEETANLEVNQLAIVPLLEFFSTKKPALKSVLYGVKKEASRGML